MLSGLCRTFFRREWGPLAPIFFQRLHLSLSLREWAGVRASKGEGESHLASRAFEIDLGESPRLC